MHGTLLTFRKKPLSEIEYKKVVTNEGSISYSCYVYKFKKYIYLIPYINLKKCCVNGLLLLLYPPCEVL